MLESDRMPWAVLVAAGGPVDEVVEAEGDVLFRVWTCGGAEYVSLVQWLIQ
jgi:hypothetical protein